MSAQVERFLSVVGAVALVLALWYRKEISWAVRNRQTIKTAAGAADLVDQVGKAF